MKKLFLTMSMLIAPVALADNPTDAYGIGTICHSTDGLLDSCETFDTRYDLEGRTRDKNKIKEIINEVSKNISAGASVTVSYTTKTTNPDGSSSSTTIKVEVKANAGGK